MTTLLTADIHMTTSPRDEYRFGLFSWLAEQANLNSTDQVIILGDITEKSDRHPSQLVNRVVMGISEIAEVCPVYVLRGNHDAVSSEWPFFAFLSGIPNVIFISHRIRMDLKVRDDLVQCCFLPASDDPLDHWKNLAFETDGFIFLHQTVIGAAYESGMPADKGLPLTFFNGSPAEIFSGDIHSPQRIDGHPGMTYVGAPYRVDFGDRYTPRCLLLSPGGDRDLRFPCPVKHALDVTGDGEIILPKNTKIAPGDHVRVRVRLTREQLPLWPRIRAALIDMGKQEQWGACVGPSLELLPSDALIASQPVSAGRAKLQPVDVLKRFSERHQIEPDVADVGAVILREAGQ